MRDPDAPRDGPARDSRLSETATTILDCVRLPSRNRLAAVETNDRSPILLDLERGCFIGSLFYSRYSLLDLNRTVFLQPTEILLLSLDKILSGSESLLLKTKSKHRFDRPM